MNISVSKLLDKIETELKEAKYASTEGKIRERIYAIKSMCELVLEDTAKMEIKEIPFARSATTPFTQPVETLQQKPMKLDDEANGDSIFDF